MSVSDSRKGKEAWKTHLFNDRSDQVEAVGDSDSLGDLSSGPFTSSPLYS